MRICPKCGYVDLPIWRNTRWRYYTEHCHIDELRLWQPKLAEKLLAAGRGKTILIKGVKYRLAKNGIIIHRIPAALTRRPLSDSVEEPRTEKAQWNPLSHKLEEFF